MKNYHTRTKLAFVSCTYTLKFNLNVTGRDIKSAKYLDDFVVMTFLDKFYFFIYSLFFLNIIGYYLI